MHRAPCGRKIEAFEKVRDGIIESLPKSLWGRYHKPTMTTVCDKLHSVMAERKVSNGRDQNTSGVEEVILWTKELLDEFVAGIDNAVQENHRELDDQSMQKKNLIGEEEQIQRSSLTCWQSVGDGSTGSNRSTPRKRKITDD